MPGPVRRLDVLLVMATFGGLVIVAWFLLLQSHWRPLTEDLSRAEREQIMFIAFLEGLGFFLGGVFGAGVFMTRKIHLAEEATRPNALRAFWSALLGLPTGFCLFSLRLGEVARARLPQLELWSILIVSVLMLVKGMMDAKLAWRLRRELRAFY